jgi:hypothetical protein
MGPLSESHQPCTAFDGFAIFFEREADSKM